MISLLFASVCMVAIGFILFGIVMKGELTRSEGVKIFILGLLLSALMGWLLHLVSDDRPTAPRPCSNYANEHIQYVPAHCLKEYLR